MKMCGKQYDRKGQDSKLNHLKRYLLDHQAYLNLAYVAGVIDRASRYELYKPQ